MDWDDLRFALAVARAGSVTRAARVLGVAHTTVARRVAALEASSGVALFQRAAGDATLTSAGRDLLAVGTEVEKQFLDFERRLASRDERLEGEVTVATMRPLASQLSTHLLAFRRLHPGIRIRLHATNDIVDLARGEADIAVRATSSPDESLVGRCVASLAFAAYVADGFGWPSAADDLSALEWVCFDASLARSPQGRWEEENVPKERVVLRTNSRTVFAEAVAAGAGAGVMPCGLAAQMGGLRALSARIASISLPLWLLTHADLRRTPRVRALLDYLATVFDGERPMLEGAGLPLAPTEEELRASLRRPAVESAAAG
jgi:DNA-binding transcriptional LysR family regulator